MKRVGLLGGSFNPAHVAHRRISLAAIDRLALDEVWWLVSPGNPLKDRADMAPLAARLDSALAQARHARIRATAIEAKLGTRYTVDSIAALKHRFPKVRFIWLMGADNLAGFDRWWRWRDIARMLPIAVIARPGYDGGAHRAVAMGWFRRFVHRADQAKHWTAWRFPALVMIAFRPDPTSATALRARDPRWAARFTASFVTAKPPNMTTVTGAHMSAPGAI